MARWMLRVILFVFGRLIYIDKPDRLKRCPWPVIFALNHNNYSESILVPGALIYLFGGKIISFLVHWMFKLLPLIGWMLKQIDPIWVYNRRVRWGWMNRLKPLQRPDIFEQARLRIKRGQSVGIFPEGTRNHNPDTLKRGRLGIGQMVLESRVPVLPVGIDFPYRIKHGKIPVLGKMFLRIGKPLYFEAERKEYNSIRSNSSESDSGLSKADQIPTGKNRRQKVNTKTDVKAREKLLALYARVSHKIMREISRLCGKEYPYYEK